MGSQGGVFFIRADFLVEGYSARLPRGLFKSTSWVVLFESTSGGLFESTSYEVLIRRNFSRGREQKMLMMGENFFSIYVQLIEISPYTNFGRSREKKFGGRKKPRF